MKWKPCNNLMLGFNVVEIAHKLFNFLVNRFVVRKIRCIIMIKINLFNILKLTLNNYLKFKYIQI